jgi:hypothetical protein
LDIILHIAVPIVWAGLDWAVIWIPVDGHDIAEITSASGSISVQQESHLKKIGGTLKNLLHIWKTAYKGVKRTVPAELLKW